MTRVTNEHGTFSVDRMPNRSISVFQLDGGNLQAILIRGKWWYRRADGGGMNGYDHPDENLAKDIKGLCRKSRAIEKANS